MKQQHQQHLNLVQSERELYRKVCEEAKYSFETMEDQINLDERHEACSLLTTMHYSFDFAQQIHIPSNPMQPDPIYFKTPRKCAIFGVMCEAIPRQVNYLIDEASDAGKGANATISYVHHDGTVIVPVYNWSSYLEQFYRKLPNIKSYQHFRFSRDEPGRIYFKERNSSLEQSMMLLKNRTILPPASQLPAKVNPAGLSQERKQYLHREIRQFCKPGTEDLVAPAP